MRIRWSALASKHIVEIAAYIAETSPVAAARWLDTLEAKVGRLADFPRSGTPIPDFQGDNLRQIVLGRYRVVYRVEMRSVLILTVRHTARRPLRRSPRSNS